MHPRSHQQRDNGERLTELERRLRRLRNACVGTGILIGTLLLTAQVTPDNQVVEGSEFRLLDDRGELRAVLRTADGRQGGTTLQLFDQGGTERFAVGVSDLLQFIRLNGDDDGLYLAAGPLAIPQLHFSDSSGVRVAIDVRNTGPILTLRDDDSNPRLVLGVSEDAPAVLLLDRDEQVVRSLVGGNR